MMKRRAIAIAAALALTTVSACASPEQRVERYVKSGDEYLAKGDLGRANVQFQNALKINEESVPALLGVAEIAEKKEDYGALFGILQEVVRLEPDNFAALIKLGKLQVIGADDKAADETSKKALALDPENVDALALRAAIDLKLGDRAGAVEYASKAVAKDPSNSEAIAVLAADKSIDKDFEGALQIVDAGIKAKNDQPALHLMRIQLLANLGRRDAQKKAHEDLIKLHPDKVAYRQLYAKTLIEGAELAPARLQLEEVARLNPDSLDAKLDVVRVAYQMGGADEARKTFEAYSAAQPGNVDLSFAFADYLRQIKDFAGAETLLKTLDETEKGKPASRRARNELAAMKLIEGKKDEARALIDSVLKEDAKDGDAITRLASLKIDEGKPDEAIADLRSVIADKPDANAAKVLLATAFEKKGDLEYADSQMAIALNDSGFDPRIANVYARFQLRKNDVARAEKTLSDALVKHPGDAENLKLLAAVQLMQQNWRGAEETAKLIKAAGNEDDAASRVLGAAYAGLKDYKGAIEALNSADAVAPLAAQPLALLVSAYVKDGRPEDALARLAEVIEKNPKNYEARLLVAQTYGSMKKNEEAEEALKAAINVDPARLDAVDSLYRYYRRASRDAEAGALAERAVAAAPENDGFKILLADYYIAKARVDDAIALYGDVLARQPNFTLAANNYASLILESKDDQESREKALAAARVLKDQDNPYFLDTYAWALVKTGNAKDAIAPLEKALATTPNFAEGRYHLGAALVAAGEKERGVAELRKSIDGAGGAAFAEKARALLAENQ